MREKPVHPSPPAREQDLIPNNDLVVWLGYTMQQRSLFVLLPIRTEGSAVLQVMT